MTPIILLLGLGLILILAEVLIPSMGMIGIAATICILGAIAWAFTLSMDAGLNVLMLAGVMTPAMMVVALKILPMSPLTRKLTARGFSFEDGSAVDGRDKELLGHEGVVEAKLRPAGIARIDDRRVDVVSRSEMIEEGTRVRVVEVLGNRVVVQRIERTGE
ncbi:MAG: membrane-bound serine protease (ClpP class) [Planctomycetota bacterium]|jgi:membrane-bound serine protease (ClpP class)